MKLDVVSLQAERWPSTYRSAVTLSWMRKPSFTSLCRSYSHCTTSTTSSSCTGTWRHRTFSSTSTRWSSKLATLAFPKSSSARAKRTLWVGPPRRPMCSTLRWVFYLSRPAGSRDSLLHFSGAVWRKAVQPKEWHLGSGLRAVRAGKP